MARIIFKYALDITDEQDILVKRKPGSWMEFIHVGLDAGGMPAVWIAHEPGNKEESITFYVVGTGNPIPEEAGTHVGSFVQAPFVWHVYV